MINPYVRETEQEKALRIAWQYKKYFGEQNLNSQRDGKAEYCNDFDLRKPLERHILIGQSIDCVSFQECSNVATLYDRCSTFLAPNHRSDGGITCGGRIAIQSLCTPQCDFSNKACYIE
ncbi:hypothetical protein Leryth_009897 [Lithospermum erythrorhizon]|nr:hypothetical protein Leryth_009897 [Lithospermum erythrorhizon]